jgi:hypothetical protein
MRRRQVLSALVCAALLWLNAGCRERDDAELGAKAGLAAEPQVTAVEPLATTAEMPPGVARDSLLQPGALGGVTAASVEHWRGPGGEPFEVTLRTTDPATALARRFGSITMNTALRERSPDLGQYPCASCHLGRRIVMADDRIGDAHRNITSVHPVQTGGTCSTCHSPDNVEMLALKSGESATLDHTYRLCAQCHFSQAEAWAGGAHGKRLDGWQGRRVVMGCADCHDPHKPGLEPRIPFRAPQIERPRGRGR